MKKGTKKLWTGMLLWMGICFGIGDSLEVTAGETVAETEETEAPETEVPEVPRKECRILEVQIDGEVREEELLYRGTGELKVEILGEGEPSVRLIVSGENGEQETELRYRENLPELWSASAYIGMDEGMYFFRIFTETDGEQEERYRSPVIVADGTAPVICGDSVHLEADGIVCDGKEGMWFSSRNTCFSVMARDTGSGIAKISVYGRTEEGEVVLLGEQQWQEGEAAQTCSVVIKEEGLWDIGVTAEDRSGNAVEAPLWVCRLLLEQKAPKVALTAAEKPGVYGIFRKDVRLHIGIREEESGLFEAGLTANGKKIWAWTAESGYSVEEDVLLKAEDFQGETHLVLKAVDRAGNEAETEQLVSIDTVPPEICLEFEAQKPVNGKYYAMPRQARLRIREKSFREDGVCIRNGREELEQPVFLADETGEWQEAVLTFETDGTYALQITCEDLAGNVGVLKESESFVIDRTAPDVQVSYGKEEAESLCFPVKRKAYIRVEEANPDLKGFQWSLQKDGKIQEPPKAQKLFEWKEGVGNAVLLFEEEGTYTWSLQAVDQAGNCSQIYESEAFTLDFTAPFLRLEGIENASSNQGKVCPKVVAEDANYRADSLEVKVCRDGGRELPLPAHTEQEEGKEWICYEDLPGERRMDGRYRIEARAVDQAGNESNGTWQFTVNRFGSEFIFGEEICRAEEKQYVNYVPDIRIVEKNPDDIIERRLLLRTEDGVRVLKEGKDYRVTASGGGEQWNSYLYEVCGNAIAADGRYHLSLHTKDRAGNQMDSREQQAMAFCLDRTAPVVSITGVKDQEVISGRPREICVEVKDSIGVDKVVFRMNGEETTVYNAEEVQEADGVFRMTVTQKNHLQKLEVEALDLAGNRTVPRPLTFWAVKERNGKAVQAKSTPEMQEEAKEVPEEEDSGTWKLPAGIVGGGAGMGIFLVYFFRKHRSSFFVR